MTVCENDCNFSLFDVITQANRLHLTSLVNRINQTEGAKAKEVVKPSDEPMNYFTQYKRVHDNLGHLLGPGVEREYPIRDQYNIITGKKTQTAPSTYSVTSRR